MQNDDAITMTTERFLGLTATDKITGFTGVITGYVAYLTGCHQVLVQPAVAPDGALRDSAWFDVQRMMLGKEDRVVLDNGATPGCDRAAPKR